LYRDQKNILELVNHKLSDLGYHQTMKRIIFKAGRKKNNDL